MIEASGPHRAKKLRRARHAVPLQNRRRRSDAAPGVVRRGGRPYKIGERGAAEARRERPAANFSMARDMTARQSTHTPDQPRTRQA